MGGGVGLLILVMVLFMMFSVRTQRMQQDTTVNFPQFEKMLSEGEISSVVIRPNREIPTGEIDIVTKNGERRTLSALDTGEVEQMLRDSGTEYRTSAIRQENYMMSVILPILLSAGILLFFFTFMNARAGGGGANAKMIKDLIGFDWGKNLYSFAVPGMDGDGFNMCHKVGAGHTPVTMEMMYQLPDNMNHFYVEGGFRQPCYWCDRNGERFMPEDDIFNTTFVGNAINHLPGKVAFSIFDSKMLKHWKKDGPDIVSHVHPKDLYQGFEEQFDRDEDTYLDGDGNHVIAKADTLEELAEKIGIDPEGLVKNVEEYNAMCAEGWDTLFEKEREFMQPLENGPFYACRQYVGAYGTLGGVLINQRMEVMTDEYKTIPGLYCVGTDACTIYGDSYNYSIPGNTMGFCLNSGRIAGENAAALSMESASDDEWD